MIQYYYTKKEWGVVMEKEELKILEELRRILNSKNEAIVILNNYFKGGVGKSKLSTMFAYLTDKFNLKVLMIDKDLQATLTKTSVYKGYKQDKIEMRGDRAEMSDFPLYLNMVASGLDCRDQAISGFSFVVKIYALPVVEIIGQLLYLLGRYGFNAQFGDCL